MGIQKVDGVSVDRIKDAKDRFSTTFKETAEVADFLVFKEPMLIYIECKSTKKTVLQFSNIRDSQWDGLAEKHKIKGVYGYILVWFYPEDGVNNSYLVPIDELWKLRATGKKSLSLKDIREGDINVIPVQGKRQRTYVLYDFSDMFENIKTKGKLPLSEWFRQPEEEMS